MKKTKWDTKQTGLSERNMADTLSAFLSALPPFDKLYIYMSILLLNNTRA